MAVILLAPLAVLVCAEFLDQPVARWSAALMTWLIPDHGRLPDLPDLLLPVVALATPAAWIAYLVLRRLERGRRFRACCHLVGVTLPLAFMLKSLLKAAFGRMATRTWLLSQPAGTFHWLQGRHPYDGFPSGHMMVATVLALAARHHLPPARTAADLALALLAVALVSTSYHFVGDVVAGWAFAYLIHASLVALPELREGAGN